MSALMRLAASGRPSEPLYSDSVFSAYTYTGNGSTQTITNGIDLAGKGGMVWVKSRSSVTSHYLQDSARNNFANSLLSDTTSSQWTSNYIVPTATGFTTTGNTNLNSQPEVSWTFRKAPKFFDVVTWTGNGANRTIAHSLGSVPGMIVVKLTSSTSNWHVYHQSIANTEYLLLNTTAAKATDATLWNSSTATSSVFSLGTNASVNQSGQTYVAYLFAHDTATDGLIQCGSFTTDGSGNATVSLGWEPQYLMVKASSTTLNWQVVDSSREFTVGNDNVLNPNTTTAEGATVVANPTATGFYATTTASQTFVYLAIRRPNKPPTVGTQVYNAIARTGTGAAATVTGVGFAPDLVISEVRAGTYGNVLIDKLRGSSRVLIPTAASAEGADTVGVTAFGMDGFSVGTDTAYGVVNTSPRTNINWCFKRAPGVFDVVCYTGTGVAKTEAHGLGVVPELMIVRSRNYLSNDWFVYVQSEGATKYLVLQTTAATATNSGAWNNTAPTASVFTLGGGLNQNVSGYTGVAYLFATKAGVSKVGSYTGNATTNAINCGFTTGARFVLIKRTDSTGDWYVWDTLRGIIAGNDPYLLLNSAAAEVTSTDYIDPYTSGFELSSTAPAAINASGGTYIYLAFA